MRTWIRRAAALLVVMLLVPALYIAWIAWQAHGGLPRWEGEQQVAGLEGSVTIRRDAQGIPHIRAGSLRDAVFAQGFVHAQDRFWQLSLVRQRAAGRLSEWFGGVALRGDALQRMTGGEPRARRLFDVIPAEERKLLQAYADGVNAWLDSDLFRTPPEMRLLHVDAEPWRAEDVFLVYQQVHDTLSSWGNEVIRARVAANAADPAALDMFSIPEQPAPVILDPAQSALQDSATVKQGSFSDSWLLAGQHTASGQALLANDPQLPATMPNFWYLLRIELPDRTLAGATVPGLPGIAVGHNGRVAWAVTNAQIDVNDVALIERHPEDPTRYRRAASEPWQRFERETHRLKVRFADDQLLEIDRTPTGVVPPDGLLSMPVTRTQGAAAEFRFQSFEVDTSIAALLRLNQANDVLAAREALRDFSGPPLNFSMADDAGNIAYLAAGRLPDRVEPHARQVALAPEDDNDWEWRPAEDNPATLNPPSGRIVTANQRIAGDDHPFYLSDLWAAPDRALRIHRMLDLSQEHDRESFVQMQSDTLSPVAADLLPALLRTVPATPEDAALLARLADWDARFEPGKVAPLVFLTWAELLARRVLDDELGPAASLRRGNFAPLRAALLGGQSQWCDDIGTPDRQEECAELLTETLGEGRRLLAEAYGDDPDRWTFADRQVTRLPHQGLAGWPLLDGWFSRSVAVPGGPESLFINHLSGDSAPRFTDTQFTSSYQAVYDLSDLSRSVFMMSGGPSGHFASPYYENLTPRWIGGERFELNAGSVGQGSPLLALNPKGQSASD
ncbi:penicillin acylase family protein [Pseudomarimonas salicorniae]|uniref:Penicillin acylase family protein n=1 Tax=Pseudomarimonas salicorniae TaxID=2933270 RepID=A0ABT0GG72_9GAMM|nr:penicillin acylase family protein [Lysobacter sp. CAU 1642]MCK7593052.1 penicillin acylase family protein [Lysobacter sp. CAU 1642]